MQNRGGIPRMATVRRVIPEARDIATIEFDVSFPDAAPGQFVMVWLPGVDDVPMSLSTPRSITVDAVGDATRAMLHLRRGDRVGLRGPLGRGFAQVRGGRALLVAGGIGTPPLAFHGEQLARRGVQVTTLLGARSADRLSLLSRLRRIGELQVATDDGSRGHHGYVTDLAGNLRRYQAIYSCGPEAMMARLLHMCRRAGVEARLQCAVERYMKCGIGICGSCDLGGMRACAEGPVFTGPHLRGTEFGVYTRDASGARQPIQDRTPPLRAVNDV